MSEQICRFCQRYVKLSYYCQECGTSSCSDCLHENKFEFYICQDCKSKNIEYNNSEKVRVCKDCGKKNIVKVNQTLKSCPKCNSHQIINIYEKKEDLEKKFLDLIKDVRLFINPIREILTKLYKIRQEIYKARDPPIKCYHFPKMESDLLALFKLFKYVYDNLYEKINHHFQQLSLNKEYFFDIYSQPNSNITIIEGILDNLLRFYNAIDEFIVKNVKTFNESIEPFEKNLKFIDKINSYFLSYKKFLNLAEYEKPVYALYAKLLNGLNTEERLKKKKGILFITNLDLSFVYEHGVMKKKEEIIFKAPVNDLIRIKEKGKVIKKLYLEFEYGKYEFTLPSKAISRVIEYILLARTFDESTIIDNESVKKLQQIDIQINNLLNFIEESINSFFSLKCQYNKGLEKQYHYINRTHPALSTKSPQIYYNSRKNQIVTPYHPNQFSPQVWIQKPILTYPNNNLVSGNLNFLDDVNNQIFQRPQIIQSPADIFYYPNPSNQHNIPKYEENEFFIQDLFNPNRFQNYRPQKNTSFENPVFDTNKRNHLMGKLQHAHKFGLTYPQQLNYINPNLYDLPSNNYSNPIFGDDFDFQEDQDSFDDFERNHLSNFFDQEHFSLPNPYKSKKFKHKLEKEKRKKLFELNKEKYSLKETLKKLDMKFDQGIISEVDYFRNFKNLQKDIYLIEKKIDILKSELEEIEENKKTKRNFDSKKYFS
jgi:hypothetical protein